MKLRERAYDAFTEHLLRAEIKPGQFVSQRELVALTGQPARRHPRADPAARGRGADRHGAAARPADPAGRLGLIRNAFQFRLILEREAVAAFTQSAASGDRADRGGPPGDRRAAPRRASRRSSSRRPSGSTGSSTRRIIDDLGNDIISKAYRVNWIKVRLIRQSETSLDEDLVVPVMHEHLAIIRAIAARKPAEAVAAAAAHVMNARTRALRLE